MKWILHNLWIKLLAVLMAFLLWFHVATEKEYEVDVRYWLVYDRLTDDLIMASPPPGEVSVRCRGSGKNLLPLLFKERVWHIDLSSYAAGLVEIQPDPQDAPHYNVEGVEFSAIVRQSRIQFDLDRKIQKTVPIAPSFVYQTHEGYLRVGPEAIRPDSVILTGPASTLKDMTQVQTRARTFTNLSGPVDTKVELEPLRVYHVSRDIDECHLFADVQPYAEMTFPRMAVSSSPRSDGDKLQVEPDSVSVLIGGGRQALAALDGTRIQVYLDTAAIDTVPALLGLFVQVPPGFRTVNVQPDSVLVWFR